LAPRRALLRRIRGRPPCTTAPGGGAATRGGVAGARPASGGTCGPVLRPMLAPKAMLLLATAHWNPAVAGAGLSEPSSSRKLPQCR
jgi:hypothetical protein